MTGMNRTLKATLIFILGVLCVFASAIAYNKILRPKDNETSNKRDEHLISNEVEIVKLGSMIQLIGNSNIKRYCVKEKNETPDKDGNIIYPRQIARETGIGNYCKGNYGGIDCSAFIGWSIHNDGFKAENTIGSYEGETDVKNCCYRYDEHGHCVSFCPLNEMKKYYSKLMIGDQIANNDHVC